MNKPFPGSKRTKKLFFFFLIGKGKLLIQKEKITIRYLE